MWSVLVAGGICNIIHHLQNLTGKNIQGNLILGLVFFSAKLLLCVGIGGKSSVNELTRVDSLLAIC